jgi:hypothetical protein
MTWDNRGRHKGRYSRETRRWLALSESREWLRPGSRAEPAQALRAAPTRRTPPPSRPGWMDPTAYAALVALRVELNSARAEDGPPAA